jgi:hypothetical protein
MVPVLLISVLRLCSGCDWIINGYGTVCEMRTGWGNWNTSSHFVHQKSHINPSWFEPGLQWWKTSDYPPQLWNGSNSFPFYLRLHAKIVRSWDSAVSIATGCGLEFGSCVQIRSGVDPAFHPMGTRELFPRGYRGL